MKITFEDEGTRLGNLAVGDTFMQQTNDIWYVSTFSTITCIEKLLLPIALQTQAEHDFIMRKIKDYDLKLNEIVCLNLNTGVVVGFDLNEIVIPVDVECKVKR